MLRHWLLAALLLLAAGCASPLPAQVVESERARFRVEVFAGGLENPWGAAFLPDGRLLVTERPGNLRIIGTDGRLSAPLSGVPAVEAAGQGGLLDVALAPDFARTREIFLCHAALVQGGALTRLVRARLNPAGTGLENVQPLLDATPAQASGRNHYGCRIAFGPRDGFLYLSTGERYRDKQRAQRLDDLGGKVLRLTRDGQAAPGNPFAGRAGARPEVYSLGHRNPQGLAFNPWTGSLWQAEFGPRGGDEVNLVLPGRNYGWPVQTFGIDYNGARIGEPVVAGMEPPLRHWVPAVSPSGMAFYDGAAFPGWRGSLFLACLNTPGLLRLTTDGDRITGEERLLWGKVRMRQVVVGPEGWLYVLTDEADGRVLRVRPG